MEAGDHLVTKCPQRLLVVDDDPSIRLLIRLRVERDGAPLVVVGEAADGEEATLLAAQANPDVVLLDLGLPRVDGLSALPRIRELAPDSRVVVYTALGDSEEEALRAGADAWLPKTSDWPVLRCTLLGRSRDGREWS